jgi:hypothetical protein
MERVSADANSMKKSDRLADNGYLTFEVPTSPSGARERFLGRASPTSEEGVGRRDGSADMATRGLSEEGPG